MPTWHPQGVPAENGEKKRRCTYFGATVLGRLSLYAAIQDYGDREHSIDGVDACMETRRSDAGGLVSLRGVPGAGGGNL